VKSAQVRVVGFQNRSAKQQLRTTLKYITFRKSFSDITKLHIHFAAI
jgi:hypothetical protein